MNHSTIDFPSGRRSIRSTIPRRCLCSRSGALLHCLRPWRLGQSRLLLSPAGAASRAWPQLLTSRPAWRRQKIRSLLTRTWRPLAYSHDEFIRSFQRVDSIRHL